ncbi:MAG: 50S ribosomal protein L10 [Opitutales bacterium]|nr:50S ribosomal protein L10 [Opitutales bacterium]
MQAEKQFLVDEVTAYLDKSEYLFLADYNRLTVADTEELRKVLAASGAEFHVVKNTILKIAADKHEYPELDEQLKGPTAIVVGGNNAAEVAKALEKFFKDKKKGELKGGVLDKRSLSAADISELAKLPSIEILRAQLLGLLNTPATSFVRVIQAVPQGLLNVLQAKVDKDGGAN